MTEEESEDETVSYRKEQNVIGTNNRKLIADGIPQIPILSSSYKYMKQSGYRNMHYDRHSSAGRRRISLATASEVFENPSQVDCFTVGMDPCEYSPLSFNEAAITSYDVDWLKLCVDLDSIDILSFPWMGNLIRKCRIKLLQTFNPTYIESPKYLSNRSNFTYFLDLDPATYPGNMFHITNISGRGSENFSTSDSDPIAACWLLSNRISSLYFIVYIIHQGERNNS